jgi:bis(5'-nucleosyl)-tetraphosphatase (symmetrical)
MAVWAVGDIQGCFQTLLRLLDKIKFDWQKDKLWVCGDLVNRGPQSLETLNYLYQHRDRVKLVLGNHDLHMLAIASGVLPIKRKDTFVDVLEAPNRQHLIDWLLQQPLARYNKKHKTLMVHAGIAMHWDLKQTLECSQEVEQVLQHPQRRFEFFSGMYGDQPDKWSPSLSGLDRLRFITNVFTRMRFCYPDGTLDLSCKDKPGKQPEPLIPWYQLPLQIESDVRIIFGHWAALNGKLATTRFQALDTGAVWGGKLTALKLKTGKRVSVK